MRKMFRIKLVKINSFIYSKLSLEIKCTRVTLTAYGSTLPLSLIINNKVQNIQVHLINEKLSAL